MKNGSNRREVRTSASLNNRESAVYKKIFMRSFVIQVLELNVCPLYDKKLDYYYLLYLFYLRLFSFVYIYLYRFIFWRDRSGKKGFVNNTETFLWHLSDRSTKITLIFNLLAFLVLFSKNINVEII